MNTKEMILHVSLEKFSIHGFEAVSVRDIAGDVGVRESALYKHYTNKQKIYDTIILEFSSRLGEEILQIEEQTKNRAYREEKMQLFHSMDSALNLILKNKELRYFHRMIQIERFSNKKASECFQSCFHQNFRTILANPVKHCIDAGELPNVNIDFLLDTLTGLMVLSIMQFDGSTNSYRKASSFLQERTQQLMDTLNQNKRPSLFGFF